VPLYEYTCGTCHDDFTLLQPVHADPAETACPECGGHDVVRHMSAFAPAVAGGAPAPAPLPGCGNPGAGCGGGMCGL
jgi:putative FmdB family regulatory protein